MSNLEKYAKNELELAGFYDDDAFYGKGVMAEAVLKLIRILGDEGHSGASASFAISIFEKLARFEPLTPLTGEDDEWADQGYTFQNKRCMHVFKDSKDGQAYDIEGIVFYDLIKKQNDNGIVETAKSYYTCFQSRVPVTFPYVPTKEYKERP